MKTIAFSKRLFFGNLNNTTKIKDCLRTFNNNYLTKHSQHSQIIKDHIEIRSTKNVLETKEISENYEEPSFLETVRIFFDQASVYLEIPKFTLEFIKSTKSAIRFSFPLVRDNGEIEMVFAFRAQNSLHQVPTKGGTRFSENLGTYKYIILKIFQQQKH